MRVTITDNNREENDVGYTTTFEGHFTVTPPLNEDEASYLAEFSASRRMDREKGPYFVRGSGDFGQGHDKDIRNRNAPPEGQPGLWCQWVPEDGGDVIAWDGGEKFYNAEAWIKYLIDHFLKADPERDVAAMIEADERFATFTFDHVVSGTVYAHGEYAEDRWAIEIEDNVVYVMQGATVYGPRARV